MSCSWEDFRKSDLTFSEFIAPEVEAAVQRALEPKVETEMDRVKAQTAEAERRTAQLEFEKLVTQQALFGGVMPKAVRFIVSSAAELFERRESGLTARNGLTEPGDPLTPLTFDTWLTQLRKESDYTVFSFVGRVEGSGFSVHYAGEFAAASIL